jgi:hypothetical protein
MVSREKQLVPVRVRTLAFQPTDDHYTYWAIPDPVFRSYRVIIYEATMDYFSLEFPWLSSVPTLKFQDSFLYPYGEVDRLCGLVVGVAGYRSRFPEK